MSRIKKLVALVALGCLVAFGIVGAWRVRSRTLPPVTGSVPNEVRGVFHVHSEMSHDSSTPMSTIVEAARNDRLDFVLLDDHNAQYAGPVVRDGVVLLSSAELSTSFGHVVGLGSRSVLGKAERSTGSVLQKVRDLGALPVITHPTDRKQPWRGPWDGAAGLEIANFSSATRRTGGRAFIGLAPIIAAGLVNSELALAQIYDRDGEALETWDRNPDPAFLGLCGVDAHGWIDTGLNLRAWNLVLEGPMPQAEAAQPAWVLDRISHGRFYCNAGLLGATPGLTLEARREDDAVVGHIGDNLVAGSVRELVARVTTSRPGQTLVLFRNGLAIDRTEQSELRLHGPASGTYRVELWVTIPDLAYGEHVVPAAYSGRLRLTEAPPPAPLGSVP